MTSRTLLNVVLCLALAACGATPTARPVAPTPTVLLIDGQILRVTTDSPEIILGSTELALGQADVVRIDGAVWSPGDTVPLTAGVIDVRRAQVVMISEAGEGAVALGTTARTVGAALWEAGFQLRQADRVEPALATPLSAGMTITITRAAPLTIGVDGAVLRTLAAGGSVVEALSAAGVGLTGADYTVPAADGALPLDGQIRVVRVREELLATQTVERTDTIYQALADQPIDTRQLIDAGADGVRRTYTRVRYEDGLEIARSTEAEFIAQAPRARVVGYGTQITVQSVATTDGVIEYWRSYDVYATSYSPSRAGVPRTSRTFGITRSGQPLVKGLIAVDPRYIPLGTRLYIPGYGFAVAADTGGGVKGRFIDLGYSDNDYQSWARVVTVYFLTPAPPAGSIVWLIPQSIP